MRAFFWLMPFLLVASLVGSPASADDQPQEFTPEKGFAGDSEGQGTLTFSFREPRPFHVTSHGSVQSDGTFRLDQIVTFHGEAPKERFWILTTTSPNHYSATLSDAAGTVTAVTSGAHLSLRYRIKGPMVMHQELELSRDGTEIYNVGVIKVLGVTVGRLHETITRKSPNMPSDDLPQSTDSIRE